MYIDIGGEIVKFAVRSHSGMVREINEDSYNIIAAFPGIPATYIIADGMGGHNSGEVASKIAVDFASNYIMQNPRAFSGEEGTVETLRDMMKKANADIYAKSSEHGANFGMGTTMITVVVCGKKLCIGHVGDSRVYIIRDGRIQQITTDHSYIEELIKKGTLTREEAGSHPQKNVITRALGCSEDVEIDTHVLDIHPADCFVLCTDGLTNMLEEDEIRGVVEGSLNPEAACEELIRKANEKGGEDNITVIVIKND